MMEGFNVKWGTSSEVLGLLLCVYLLDDDLGWSFVQLLNYFEFTFLSDS